MLKTVIIVLIVVFAAMGLGDIMHRIYIRFIVPAPVKRYILLPLCEGDSPSQISAVLDELRWRGREYADGIICITDGLSFEQKKIIENMAASNDALKLCISSEVSKMV